MTARSVDRFRAIDAVMSFFERPQLRERRVEQPHAAAKRAALHVVIRGRELDQPLKKRLLIAAGVEPELFPRFMRVPELVLVEELHAFGDLVQSPARVPLRKTSQIADVKSVVEPVPPMSRVRTSGPMPRTFVIASPTRLAGPLSPM
jgi:hypothetical protein